MHKDQIKKIEIKIFGEFDILVNSISILNKFTRLPIIVELLQYLIANHKKKVALSKIFEDVWPDKYYQDINKVLYTYIHRLKKFLAGENYLNVDISDYIRINNYNGRYKIFISPECIFDITLFEEVVSIAENGSNNHEIMANLLDIYQDEFLKNNIYSHWVLPMRNMYLEDFNKVVNKSLHDFYCNNEYKEIIKYCDSIFKVYEFDEITNIFFIKSFIKLGRINQALEHYSYITSKMYTDLAIKPSEDLKELYNVLKKDNIHKSITSDDNSKKQIQTMFVKQFPKNFKKHMLIKKTNTLVGIFYISSDDNIVISKDYKYFAFQNIKQFVEATFSKDFYLTQFGQEEDFVAILAKNVSNDILYTLNLRANKFINSNFIGNIKIKFEFNIMSSGISKNEIVSGEGVRYE